MNADSSAPLLEANEHLVLSALRAQTECADVVAELNAIGWLAQHDALTDLPDRSLLLERMTQGMAEAGTGHGGFALMSMDLQDFTHVNDGLGHAIADKVLLDVAGRLRAAMQEDDVVSRHGSDGFLIYLAGVTRPAEALARARMLERAVRAPLDIGGHPIALSTSAGISCFPADGDDAQKLIDRAGAAMYLARARKLGSLMFQDIGLAGASPAAGLREVAPAIEPVVKEAVHEAMQAGFEHEHALQREANTHLVLAALSAQELQAEAQKACTQQTQFLAVMAHELRGPLSPIRQAAAMLGHGSVLTEPMLTRMQGVIERQVAQMSRLIGDLLDVSRMNTGKLRIERGEVDMAVVIAEAIAVWRGAIEKRGMQFAVTVPATPLWVYGDAIRLAQILNNLLDNAAKYTPDGGKISFVAVAAGDLLVITLSDSGIGITAEGLLSVFNPFAQDVHAVSFNGAGLGIGLALVRELVEAHGGSVAAHSAGKGLGSQFVVTLPLMGEPPHGDGKQAA